MAGGRGTRLEPFTKVLPKPLIPIHEKPIVEHIIDRFLKIGSKHFYLSVNYKSKILKAYFEELKPKYKISFVEEKFPLGTAGSLNLLENKIRGPFFVTNCDIIIKADLDSLFKFHQKNKYDITLVASNKEYIIPYGTCKLNEEGHLSYIMEKPQYDLLINTGLYILNHNVIKMVPENEFFNITDLIDKMIKSGGKVGVYPVDETSWIDVGQWAEYKNAVKFF